MTPELRRVPWASSYLISDRGELYSERFGGRRRKIVPYIDNRGYATITRLAQALGLSREYVSDIINGKVRTNE